MSITSNGRRRTSGFVTVVVAAAGLASAQTAPRAFDVVSIKPNTSLSRQSNLNDAEGAISSPKTYRSVN